MHKKVLILSPHTDDAELGAGGTIARFLEEGSDLYIAVFSTCEDSLPVGSPINSLLEEFYNAYDFIGISRNNLKVYNYPVRRLSEYRQEVLEILVRLKSEITPDLVILPSGYDLHQDHQVIHMEGVRAFLKSSSIWGYELPWNHKQFSPMQFIKLYEKHVELKIKMLSFYKTQFDLKRSYFSQDFIKGLARVRGVQASCEYSEAFEVIRQNY